VDHTLLAGACNPGQASGQPQWGGGSCRKTQNLSTKERDTSRWGGGVAPEGHPNRLIMKIFVQRHAVLGPVVNIAGHDLDFSPQLSYITPTCISSLHQRTKMNKNIANLTNCCFFVLACETLRTAN